MKMKFDKHSLSATQNLNRRFLSSLLVISLIIGFTEFSVMSLLEIVQKSGRVLSPLEGTLLDTFF